MVENRGTQRTVENGREQRVQCSTNSAEKLGTKDSAVHCNAMFCTYTPCTCTEYKGKFKVHIGNLLSLMPFKDVWIGLGEMKNDLYNCSSPE